MLTRIVTAIAALAAAYVVIYLLPVGYAVAVFCFLCVAAAYEFLIVTGAMKDDPLAVFSCAWAGCVPLLRVYGGEWGLLVCLFGYAAIASLWAVLDQKRELRFSPVALGLTGGAVIPLFLSSLLRILTLSEFGKYLILVPCVAAWASDTFAYLTGLSIGKHKLAPRVSPKKTVEGAVGGLVGAVGGLLLLCLIWRQMGLAQLSGSVYEWGVVLGVLGGAAGQCGDLAMSLFKRERGIKDYGRLFPGHGGVLDRFDSILFTAPLFEIIFLSVGIL